MEKIRLGFLITLWLGILGVFLPVETSQATLSSWQVTGTGNWNVSGNWLGGIPTSSGTVVINNSGTIKLPTGVSGTYRNFYTGTTNGGMGTISISGGTLTGTSTSLGTVSGGKGAATISSGTWNTASFFFVGNSGTGTLLVTGGHVSDANAYIGGNGGSGSATVSSGTWATAGFLSVGSVGTGALLVSGGYVSNADGYIGDSAIGSGSATVSSGTWNSSSSLGVGVSGTGRLTVSGGSVVSGLTSIGLNSASDGVVTVSSGTLSGGEALYVGKQGKGSLTVSGGYVNGDEISIGDSAGGSGTATVSSGTLSTGNDVIVGTSGTGTLLVSGGYVASDTGYIANYLGSSGSVTVSSGTWANTGEFILGNQGTGGKLTLQTGGVVTSGVSTIGAGLNGNTSYGRDNVVTITGSDSVWMISSTLTVGDYGSGNVLTVEDGGLVKVGDATGETILFSTHTGTNNHLQLDDGYVALYGDQTTYVTGTLVPASDIQIWSGSSWITAGLSDLSAIYYTTNADALAAIGYDGLGGYTIITSVPEPGALGLAAVGLAGVVLLRRRQKRQDKTA